MKQLSKLERAKRITKSWGYKSTDFGFDNVVKQVFAKMLVNGKTIGKDGNTGKLYTY